MAWLCDRPLLIVWAVALFLLQVANGAEIFLEWHVAINTAIKPVSVDQPVITINGMFPGPLINATTNDNIHVNLFNNMDEPLLITWNGIQQRLNSWQDGVSGTNCPIQPGKNWTYVFQTKDQIGSFFYFPSINFHKAGGGFGPIRVNNRQVIQVPFPKPEAEFDLLIGDWYQTSFKDVRSMMKTNLGAYESPPDRMLMNGKGSYLDPLAPTHESFTVTQGKTYRFRISNVGIAWSFNFRIQNHRMVLVETEGSYTKQITLDSLDVHVGQSYSVLVTADGSPADYYIVATPKEYDAKESNGVVAVGVLHYVSSTTPASGPLPSGPDPFDLHFSINQAKSIRWNMTTGAARPNPQGTFNVTNVTLSQTFVLRASTAELDGAPRYTVNNISYLTPDTPLKLADHFLNGSGVYVLDEFSTNSTNLESMGVFFASGKHKGWIELVFKNDLDAMNTWHLDGFGFYVVGFGEGEWSPKSRCRYNLFDPVVRSTVQVYPRRWSAVYAYLDNPGTWNLRSQLLKNWYLGQELYLRVFDADPDPAKERPPPDNILLCGITASSLASSQCFIYFTYTLDLISLTLSLSLSILKVGKYGTGPYTRRVG
ncbi:monocopper oxidase-like protein SKU5 [Juglans microcarpa x Juglans regia]|uniref:monocopper oxidase-like protein SKU5 n=1 Tax=Juglans microcarpa x Juglans regia TaxID=2249226 RepID=UPI001B7E80B1|nr:monocopper oxidase-like protein SKU5 [Juglans microcarpa x Juglans regia]